MASDPKDLSLEIVSHCWNYSRLLTYQLSSFVLFPPTKVDVTMTVFHALEDEHTVQTLAYFKDFKVDRVTWNWRPTQKELLFRRSIGRNMAALECKTDWVWFADCDQMFRDGCIDSLADLLPNQTAPLVYPRQVNCSDLIDLDDPLLKSVEDGPSIVDIDPSAFHPREWSKAIGGIQIVPGDILRKVGYCNGYPRYLRPANRMTKCREDRIFRRLLGTDGVPLDIPGVYRINHKHRGRRRFSFTKWRL